MSNYLQGGVKVWGYIGLRRKATGKRIQFLAKPTDTFSYTSTGVG